MPNNTKAVVQERMAGWQEFGRKHIPSNADLTLIVLKAHLVIEEILSSIICEHCTNPEDLPDVRLSFSQKLKLAYALCGFPLNPDIVEAVAIINTIRNDLAHKLESKKLPVHFARAKEIALATLENPKPGDLQPELKDDISVILYLAGYCYSFLSVVDTLVHLFKKEANKAPEPTPLPVTPPAEPGVAPGSDVAHL